MPYWEQLQSSNMQQPDHLLSVWRQQRSYRVGKLLCYWGVPLSTIALVADSIWSPFYVIATDLVLLIGCVISLLWIRAKTRPEYYWLPLYMGFWISSLPTLWVTGGIISPFFGIALVGLYALGVVMDKKSHTLFYLAFAFLHLIFFYFIEYFYALPTDFVAPKALVAVVTTATFTAIMVCIDSLIRTEKDLSLEFAEHYKNMSTAEEKLRITDLQLREAQSIARIGTWRWDLKEDRIIWDDELYKMFGISKENFDPSFKAYLQRLNPEVRDQIHNIIQRSVISGEDFTMENRRTNPDGSEIFIFSHGRVIKDKEGNVVQMVGTSQDITDRKRIESELVEAHDDMEKRVEERTIELEQSLEREKIAKEEAENANQAKMQFLANMSHEIRTPMNSILGFSELLSNEAHTAEEMREYLARINSSGAQLMHLIDDILDLSKFEAGQIPVHKTIFELRPLVDDVLNSFLPTLKAKTLELVLNYEKDVPEEVFTDAHRLNQILINLLNNALKFSEKGKVRIKVSTELDVNDGMNLCIDITDTGIGISAENQKKLFTAFSQGDSSIGRKYGGSGLGLALSRRIAEALGGKLELKESTLGEGSHFTCKIPVGLVNQSTEPIFTPAFEADSASQMNFDGKKILLVEDSPDNAFLISLYIKSLGFEIHTATDGLQAVKMAAHQNYVCILMDVQMPGMDGLEATRRIRKQGYKKPIIALTAHALPIEAAKSLEAGCNLHLTKPIDRNELINAINDQLKDAEQ